MNILYKTKQEVAAELQVTSKTVENWMRRGCPYKMANLGTLRLRPVFNLDSVRSWLDSRTAEKLNTGKEVKA